MNATEQRTHRTVTQSLGDRLAHVEPVVFQLIEQDGQLLKAGKALEGRVAVLEQELKMLTEHYVEFRRHHITVWQRLRWVVCGD